MKRVMLWGVLIVFVLFSAHLGQPVGVATGGPAGPGLLAFNRSAVIRAPKVDFARVADLDGDGDLDILAVESLEEDIHWWENTQGDGTAFTEHTVETNSHDVTIVSPGDIDGDGDIDFFGLAPERNKIRLWMNDGSGEFTHDPNSDFGVLGVSYVEATDVNNDGYVDFLAVDEQARDILWYENNGQPTAMNFERHVVTRNSAGFGAVSRLDAVDFDQDGLVDFAASNRGAGRITWWRHRVDIDGKHNFEDETEIPYGYREQAILGVAGADFDGDSDIDILALRGGTDDNLKYRVFLWENQGAETFSSTLESMGDNPGNLRWPSLDSGDINGDGAVDFVVSEWDGELCWYGNPDIPAQPSATATTTPTMPPTPMLTPTGTSTPVVTSTATATVTPGVTTTPASEQPNKNYLPLVRRSP
ncbi:MAG: FG-GAP repeat domain-containing protein [Anaerolineae bacterium]